MTSTSRDCFAGEVAIETTNGLTNMAATNSPPVPVDCDSCQVDLPVSTDWQYESLCEAVRGRSLPLVLVDLDRFDANVHGFAEPAVEHGKTIRLASKSLRVPALLKRAIAVRPHTFRGLMCYSLPEAIHLAQSG